MDGDWEMVMSELQTSHKMVKNKDQKNPLCCINTILNNDAQKNDIGRATMC